MHPLDPSIALLGIQVVSLPKVADARGNLTFIEEGNGLPFEPQRVFWTYNVPGGSKRGGHAYRKQSEIIIALNGAFDVVISSVQNECIRIRLDRADQGLLLPPLTWRWMEGFSTNGVGLHLSDSAFDEADYIRDFKAFQDAAL